MCIKSTCWLVLFQEHFKTISLMLEIDQILMKVL